MIASVARAMTPSTASRPLRGHSRRMRLSAAARQSSGRKLSA
jgi:hypothetical protein